MTVRVFHHGAVLTCDAAGSWASAVAVEGSRIVAVGGEADVAAYLRKADEVVDLRGRLLLPGFVDAHVHPIMGGLERNRCDLTGHDDVGDYQELVAAYAEAHPDVPWILGGGWSMGAFPGGLPHRAQLDAVVADRPVYLPNRDHHSGWANSRALELAGIDARTLDPPDGRIERDEHGVPTGALHEGAMSLVERVVPPDTQEDYDAALRTALAYLHSHGITGWQDAWVETAPQTGLVGPGLLPAYRRAADEGWLTARVTAAQWWFRDTAAGDVEAEVARLAALRDRIAGSDRLSAGTVKVMLDGVAETFTAAMIDPYLDACGCPTGNSGLSFLSPELLVQVVTALDAAGFQVHFHALGDRAVRDALDALEAARRANGTGDRRHHLAHLQVVTAADVARFRPLGATATIQALWAMHEEEMDELTIPFLGEERAARQYPFGELAASGATLAMGSDWPVSTPDPLAAIHVAVNRFGPGSPADAPRLGPEQALTLATALRAYTAGSAWVNHREATTGTIRPGAEADLALLDRNPFDSPAHEIADTTVDATYVAGEPVYGPMG